MIYSNKASASYSAGCRKADTLLRSSLRLSVHDTLAPAADERNRGSAQTVKPISLGPVRRIAVLAT